MFASPPSRGRLLATTLAGAWRAEAPAFEGTPAELAEVAPLLLGSGAAPLGWRKVSRSVLRETPAAFELQQSYRSQVLQSALRERDIEEVFGRLRAAGVDAVLIKGWAAARLYPEPASRPFGDIDVCVRPREYRRAAAALLGLAKRVSLIDLHAGFGESDERPFDELHARSAALRLGGEEVRVLAPEDHLRLVCVHLLRHGAWRPLWLCDVAASVEHRPESFDWARLLGGDRRRARWVACAVGLAGRLLGARTDGSPLAGAAERLPRWLVPEVLRQWETPYPTMQAPMRHRAPMRKYLRHPSGVVGDLINRWPNPIEATVRVGGPFNELPRWPFQLANCFARAARFVSTSGLPRPTD